MRADTYLRRPFACGTVPVIGCKNISARGKRPLSRTPERCHDQNSARDVEQGFAPTPREESGAKLQTQAVEQRRRFPRSLDRAQHHVLRGSDAGYRKGLSRAPSSAPAVARLYDAKELYVQVPQECRPARQRATPVRSDRDHPLVCRQRKSQAERPEIDGKVTCAGGFTRPRPA